MVNATRMSPLSLPAQLLHQAIVSRRVGDYNARHLDPRGSGANRVELRARSIRGIFAPRGSGGATGWRTPPPHDPNCSQPNEEREQYNARNRQSGNVLCLELELDYERYRARTRACVHVETVRICIGKHVS